MPERADNEVKRDSPLGAPQDVYLGIYEGSERVRGLLQALSDLGVSSEGLAVFAGAGDEAAFEATEVSRVEDEAPGGTLLRKIFAADEVEREQVYHDAVAKGSYVVQVQVPEDDKALRSRVEKVMLAHRGHYINYFGRLTFEAVMADKATPAKTPG